MSIEAMKQALDALEEHGTHYARHEDNYIKAITALREAIEFEEMVKKGTKAWADTPDGWVDDLRGGVEIVASDHTNSHQQELTDRQLLQQVLRFLQQVIAYSNEEMARLDALKKLVRDRLAQPEPGPVAWAEIGMDYVALSAKPFENAIPLYTAPVHAIDMSQERVDETAKRKHEPVAWIKNDELAYMSAVAGLGMTEWQTNLGLVHQLGDVPLYTTCPKNATTNGQEVAKSATTDWEAVAADQAMTIAMLKLEQKREWVGLTDEERAECWSTSAVQSALNIEAKLKEKNNAS
jgi:hypothetical protein